MEPLIVFAVFAAPFVFLLLVSMPLRSSLRLRFKKKDGIQIPPTCVMTGEPATEFHALRGFTGSPWHIGKIEIGLPFSQHGWKKFSDAYPSSLTFFKGGINVLVKVPLFGPYFAIFFWVPFAGFLAGLFAFVELLSGKKQLIVPIRLTIKKERIIGIHLYGVSQAFLTSFLEVNGGTSAFAEHEKSLKRYSVLRTTIIVAVILYVLGLVVFLLHEI